jgi:hypothetical protein
MVNRPSAFGKCFATVGMGGLPEDDRHDPPRSHRPPVARLPSAEPVVAVRPLGRRVEASTIRVYADDAAAMVDALRG